MDYNQQHIIDLKLIATTLWQQRKLFYWVLPITFVVSSALILCVPRQYKTSVVLAPEGGLDSSLGSLGSITATLGFNIGNLGTSDAIYPTIYPELVASPDFLVPLLETQVTSADGSIHTRYYDYMLKMQKHPFWWYPKTWLVRMLSFGEAKKLGGRPVGDGQPAKEFDTFWLNKLQLGVLSVMSKNITCFVDKQTDLITITVKDQDKLICATMADTVSLALQQFITSYRTQKARIDAEYYAQMREEALVNYQQAYETYVNYADSHFGLSQERYRIEADRLKRDMEQKQNICELFQQQYVAASAKLQENIPVYTVIQSASVPYKASSPKRVLFVLGMLVLASIITSIWITRKQLLG